MEQSRVLLIGAGIATRSSLPNQLASLGFECQMVQTAHETLDLVKQNTYAAAFLGPAVKDMSYLDLIPTFKLVTDLPLIILTHMESHLDIEACLEHGADDILLVPTQIPFLKVRLRHALERRNLVATQQNVAEREMLLKLEHDIQVGRQIQMSFLPSELPEPEGWQIATRFHPAREVAGDFYDSFYIWNKRRVCFLIADVSDKGIPAALFMAIFRTLLRAGSLYSMNLGGADALDPVLSPVKEQKDWSYEVDGRRRKLPTIGISQLGSIVTTNSYITETHGLDAYFVTLFFGVLDPRTGDLIYVNGGHNPPVVLRTTGEQVLLKPTGPAVGVLPEAKYNYAHIKLNPGDLLFAYTDGVTEARAPDGAFLTDKRLYQLLERPFETAVEAVNRVEAELEVFIADAEQFDDITMLCLKRLEVP